jgi:hypothetical protein
MKETPQVTDNQVQLLILTGINHSEWKKKDLTPSKLSGPWPVRSIRFYMIGPIFEISQDGEFGGSRTLFRITDLRSVKA